MTALGASRDSALAEETFQFARTGVRDQDVPRCLLGLQRNPRTRRFLAERVKCYFDELEKRYAGTFNFKRFIEVRAFPRMGGGDTSANGAWVSNRYRSRTWLRRKTMRRRRRSSRDGTRRRMIER